MTKFADLKRAFLLATICLGVFSLVLPTIAISSTDNTDSTTDSRDSNTGNPPANPDGSTENTADTAGSAAAEGSDGSTNGAETLPLFDDAYEDELSPSIESDPEDYRKFQDILTDEELPTEEELDPSKNGDQNDDPGIPPNLGKIKIERPAFGEADQRSLEEICDFPPIRKVAIDRILQKKKKYATGGRSWSKVGWAFAEQGGNMIGTYVLNRVMGGVINLAGQGITSLGQTRALQAFDNFFSFDTSFLFPGRVMQGERANTWHPFSWTWNSLFPGAGPDGHRGEDIAAAMTAREASNGVLTAIRESKITNVEGLKQVHDELMAESKILIETLDPTFQEKIAVLDERISQDLGNQQGDLALKKMIRREEVYLNLPHPDEIMNIAQYGKYGNEACRKKIDQNVAELIESYPKENEEILRVVIQQIRDNSILKNTNPVQAYLYGPPGTGKTTFVERLGEALHLYVCPINLSSLEAHELLGPEQPDDWVSVDDFKALGKIGDCLRKSTHRNIIIFFDEAGPVVSGGGGRGGYDYNSMKKQMLQEQFKKILDPSNNQEIMLNTLGIKLQVDRVTYIMAGNTPITNEALASRLPQIIFRKLGVTEKQNAMIEKFDVLIKDLRDVFNVDEVNKIEKIGREYFDFIIQEDEKRNPGARVIKEVTAEFLNYVRILVMDQQRDGSGLISDRKLKKFITDSFNRRKIEQLPN